MISETSSRAINWLRFPLIVMVLVVHIHTGHLPYVLTMRTLSEGSMGQQVFSIIITALEQIGFMTVPCFFLIAGFFFYKGMQKWEWDRYGRLLGKRVRTLLLPYILFNLISMSVLLTGESNALAWRNHDMLPLVGWFWDSTTYCVGMKNAFGFDMQLFYPEDIPLWFIRDLMVMVIISPIIYSLMKRIPRVTLCLLFIVYVSGLGVGWKGFGSSALMFCTLGMYFSLKDVDMTEWAWHHRFSIHTLSVVLLIANVAFDGMLYIQQIQQLFYLAASFSALSLAYSWASYRQHEVWPIFPKASFFVYALHMAMLGSTCLLYQCHEWALAISGGGNSLIGCLTYFITDLAMIIGICMAVYILMSRICPRLLSLFTGGRV